MNEREIVRELRLKLREYFPDLQSHLDQDIITKNDWNNFFHLYQQIPEFKLENSNMTLEQFKIIFWWEYAHRLLGRIIGLLYLVPIMYFTYKKFIEKKSF